MDSVKTNVGTPISTFVLCFSASASYSSGVISTAETEYSPRVSEQRREQY